MRISRTTQTKHEDMKKNMKCLGNVKKHEIIKKNNKHNHEHIKKNMKWLEKMKKKT